VTLRRASESRISDLESRIPNHSIYTGSFAELEVRWTEVIAELQQGDPLREINVLIGSNILAAYLKRRLAENGRTAANIRFHTFLDLANRLAAAAGSTPKKPPLSRLGACIILENILSTHSPPVYASLSSYRGFRDAVLDTFRDLRDAGFGAQELDLAIRGGNRTQDRPAQLMGLADLYRRFREQASLFHDADDDFRAAIRNVSESKVSLNPPRLLVYGIYDATGQQSRLLAALKSHLEMIYFIPFVDEAVSDFARPFLETRTNELEVNPVPLKTLPPGNSLSHLAARGFGFLRDSDSKQELRADGTFALISAPGESREAIEIVREIFRSAHDGTISGFHQAAVILRQPENDIPILTEAFRLHNLPYFIHGGGRFAERPLSRAIVALSGLESNSFSREAILTAMELVTASLPEVSASTWDVQSWRAMTNDSRFLSGLQSWDAGTQALVEQATREMDVAEKYPDEAEETEPDAGVPSIRMARRRLESARLLREAWKLLRYAAADWPAGMSWWDWARFLEQHLEQMLGTSKDWPLFTAVLDELGLLQTPEGFQIPDSKLRNDNLVSSDRLRSALLESMSGLAYPMGHFQRSGVNLLSTSAARGLRFPLVIIPGLDEGRFPAKLRQDPLLLDSERLGMKNLPLKSKRMEEEKLLFDMAARSAEKRLVLMTSRLDESSDREKIPSQYYLRAAASIRGGVVSMRDLTQGYIPGFRSISLDNPAPKPDDIAVDEGEIRLRLITSDQVSARTALQTLAQLEPARLEKPMAYDNARWLKKLTGFDGLISDPALRQWASRKTGPSAGQFSASRIEEYAKCPYFFFLKRAMDLEAWKEQGKVEGMDPLDRGLVVHVILEAFLKQFGGESFHATSNERLQQMLEQQAFRYIEGARPGGMPDLLWEIERDALITMLRNWLVFERKRGDAEMRVNRLEQPFGEIASKEKHPAFRLQAGEHVFDFRGRIDRIDISRDGRRARVIDYKTGTVPETMARRTRTPLMSGERIQIIVYRGALSVLNGFENLMSIEGEYLHLQPRDGRIVPCSFSDEELQEASRRLPHILEIIGDGIESGVFFARTRGTIRPAGHCEFCDYLTVCGKDRIRREERKGNDSAVRKFVQILEPLQ
jgi:ATP-dependent helicase/nuclease subunit B